MIDNNLRILILYCPIERPDFKVIAKIDFRSAPDLPVVLPSRSKPNLLRFTQPAANFCNTCFVGEFETP